MTYKYKVFTKMERICLGDIEVQTPIVPGMRIRLDVFNSDIDLGKNISPLVKEVIVTKNGTEVWVAL